MASVVSYRIHIMAIVVKSMATSGVEGFMVEIEASTIRGQQQMLSIIGLPDQAIKEAGERIQAAIESCGYDIPKDKVIISLASGDKKKRGSHFDLGMIIALLYQTDQISPKKLGDYAFIGELSLDGRIRPCNGVLSMVIEARKSGIKAVVVPYENRQEACSVTGIKICPVKSLKDTIRLLEDRVEVTQQGEIDNNKDSTLITVEDYTDSKESDIDFADVKGQDDLIEAIVLGAAGGHNILMLGEPGCGKTMIAQRIPTILPRMSEKESLEVTKIQSISGHLEAGTGMVRYRPFRAPHHNVLNEADIIEKDVLGKVGVKRIHLFVQERNDAKLRSDAESILKASIENGVDIITREDVEYPRRFQSLNDMPILLYLKGKLKINETPYSAGIIGARRCSQEGKNTAISAATKAINKGGIVISGMAKGIDSYAHTAALKENGYTIAVLGNGPDICYPPEHQSLYDEIAKRGCIVSEYPPGTKPRSYMFPLRNRIIAAFSDEVFVIEAGRNSGTQTTVESCDKYGRKVVVDSLGGAREIA